MFCMNCGKPTEGDRTICDACAAAQQPQQSAQPQAPVWQDVQQPVFQQPAAPQSTPAADDSFVLNMPGEKKAKKKKSKGGLIALIVALVLVAAAAVAAFLNWDYITSFFNRNMSNPKDYMETVEHKAQEEGSVVDIISSIYGSLRKRMGQSTGAGEVDLRLTLDDNVLQGIASGMGLGSDVDLGWLKEILLEIDSNVTSDGIQMDVGIGLQDTRALTLSVILDMMDGMGYVGVPELSNAYAEMDMNEMADMDLDAMADMMEHMSDVGADFQKALPEEADFKAMLIKYIDLAISQIEDVEKETDTVEIDGIEQEFTVLKSKIYQEDLVNMGIAILEEAQEDETLRDLVTAFCDYMNNYNELTAEMNGYSYVGEMDADDLFDSIPYLIEDLEDTESSDENYIILKTYVDKTDKIQGRSVKISGSDVALSYITVWDGDKFAFEADLSDMAQMKVEGTGTKKDGKVTASYDLVTDSDEEMFTIELDSFDTAALADGALSGTIRLIPGELLMEELEYTMDNAIFSLLGNADLALEMKLDSTQTNTSSVELRILVGNKAMMALGLDTTVKDSPKIDAPASTVDIVDENELMQ